MSPATADCACPLHRGDALSCHAALISGDLQDGATTVPTTQRAGDAVRMRARIARPRAAIVRSRDATMTFYSYTLHAEGLPAATFASPSRVLSVRCSRRSLVATKGLGGAYVSMGAFVGVV